MPADLQTDSLQILDPTCRKFREDVAPEKGMHAQLDACPFIRFSVTHADHVPLIWVDAAICNLVMSTDSLDSVCRMIQPHTSMPPDQIQITYELGKCGRVPVQCDNIRDWLGFRCHRHCGILAPFCHCYPPSCRTRSDFCNLYSGFALVQAMKNRDYGLMWSLPF